jgi:hypothetical protein
MTNEELQEYAKQKHLPQAVWEKMTPAEYSKWQFLVSRDTDWAKERGGAVPYYPSQRYIEKNLAPELGMSHMQLDALAQANQIARKNKLMSPQLADKMLPTLLVEGATGVNGWGYPDTPKYRDILTKAGLPPTREEIMQTRMDTDYDRNLLNSKLMHAVMAAKAAQYGDDLALERWNGKGTNARRGADSENHYRKVLETDAMLKHPKNKEIMDTWGSLSQRYAGEAPQELRPAEETYSWEDENLPAALGNAVKAVRTAMPDVSVKKIQDTIRNFTAPTMVPKEEAKKKGGAVKMPDNYSKGSWKII